MSVSIRQVAARAGVSLSTVSKVLNNADGAQIALSTQERVRHAALELNYHPSAVARALTRKRMDTLGFVLPPGHDSPLNVPFFTLLFNALLAAAGREGQNVTIFTGHRWKSRRDSLRVYTDGRCDGFILFYQNQDSDIFGALLDAHVPAVLVNDIQPDSRLMCVDIDNRAAAEVAVEHLWNLGHRRIAFFSAEPYLRCVPEREAGFRAALEARGQTAEEASAAVWPGSWLPTSVQERATRLAALAPEQRPSAVFCSDDQSARVAAEALEACGLSVPGDISVLGINDDAGATITRPHLSTLRQPYDDIAKIAVSSLLAQINRDEEFAPAHQELPVTLVSRESTAPPAQNVLD